MNYRVLYVTLLFLSVCTAKVTAQETEAVVRVTVQGHEILFDTMPRLNDVYRSAQLPAALYWPATRLISTTKQQEIERKQNQVVNELIAMSAYYADFDEYEVADALRALAAQVRQWPLVGAEAIGVTRINERHDTQPGVSFERPSFFSSASNTQRDVKHNPMLAAGDYEFIMPPSSDFEIKWRLAGLTHTGDVESIAYSNNQSIRELLKSQQVFDKHQHDTVTLIDLTGQVTTVPVAYFDRSGRTAPYGSLIFISIPDAWLIDRYRSINQQLIDLVRFWNPVS